MLVVGGCGVFFTAIFLSLICRSSFSFSSSFYAFGHGGVLLSQVIVAWHHLPNLLMIL
jgi:hypothetical protein